MHFGLFCIIRLPSFLLPSLETINIQSAYLLGSGFCFPETMGRAKLEIKKIKEYGPRQGVYTNRKSGVVKKADELAILCNIDVALTMFSPAGRPTTFASNGRSEEIYLRYFRSPETRRGHVLDASVILSLLLSSIYGVSSLIFAFCDYVVVPRLAYSWEAQISEARTRIDGDNIEALKEEINLINEKVKDTSDKLRIYIPVVEDIRSIMVAEFYERILAYSLLRLEVQWDELTREWVNNVPQHSAESIKIPVEDIENMETMLVDSADSEQINELLGKGKVVESVNDPEAEKDNLASEVAYEGYA
ncbi:hypothetical protein C5167_009243 [Papaver somniferum]|uniref:MADS-box domain-containing protein n=1 Tax=Papaver somniferum TaxID=3469 RepID=A0A4Y7JZQ9_PAPSO|nr:hypothetical protein C5167_009243 [Papaver somniferum]